MLKPSEPQTIETTQRLHFPAEPSALTLLKHPLSPWLNDSQCPVLPPLTPGEPARREAWCTGGGARRKAPALVSFLLCFRLIGLHTEAGLGLTLHLAQPSLSGLPPQPKEPLALPSAKGSLKPPG